LLGVLDLGRTDAVLVDLVFVDEKSDFDAVLLTPFHPEEWNPVVINTVAVLVEGGGVDPNLPKIILADLEGTMTVSHRRLD
jgi:hypothetical protein